MFEKLIKEIKLIKEKKGNKLYIDFFEANELKPEQWQAFGAALKDSEITELCFSSNNLDHLTVDKWRAFRDALKNTYVQEITYAGNGLTSVQAQKIDLVCKRNASSLRFFETLNETKEKSVLSDCDIRFSNH